VTEDYKVFCLLKLGNFHCLVKIPKCQIHLIGDLELKTGWKGKRRSRGTVESRGRQ
jgi:hypothetical protein